MRRRVLKWDVPVDGEPHKIGTGRVVLVACQTRPDVVQVWTEEWGQEAQHRPVLAVGTGQPVPQTWAHVGSTLAGRFVWHVFEAPPGEWGP